LNERRRRYIQSLTPGLAEYKGWTLVDVYRENGVSGYKKERPAMDRLLADSQAGRFDKRSCSRPLTAPAALCGT